MEEVRGCKGKYEEVVEVGEEVLESQDPRSRGPKDQDISKSHSNTSLTLKKVHLVPELKSGLWALFIPYFWAFWVLTLADSLLTTFRLLLVIESVTDSQSKTYPLNASSDCTSKQERKPLILLIQFCDTQSFMAIVRSIMDEWFRWLPLFGHVILPM